MRISDWSSDVCSSDLRAHLAGGFPIPRGPPRESPGANVFCDVFAKRLVSPIRPSKAVRLSATQPPLHRGQGDFPLPGPMEQRAFVPLEIRRACCRAEVCHYV